MLKLEIQIVSILPEMLSGFTEQSILKKAQECGIIKISCINPRDFTKDKHKTCDDKPFGGGSGMVLKPEPIFEAVGSIKRDQSHIILLSPQGKKFTHVVAQELASLKHIILICGNYEGVDERVRLGLADETISIGDYVLTNGTLAAAVMADSICRLVPGVLGNTQSHEEESFVNGILEYPQYTRPRVYRGMEVPEILLNGDHKKIESWRKEQAIKKTKMIRPDLIKGTNHEKRTT